MTTKQRELEARRLKVSKMQIKTIVEKEKYWLSNIGGKIC